ncbi:hypothetical protein HU200_063305 [Digitaria exilis]|uniref:DUF674 family protein n=1 Tax=Digitaria exilis TaxID=1010633 RepID=A0A835DZB9_9POAL|nr:hypothetical protein HU200_063305 [Digitaria exilis]
MATSEQEVTIDVKLFVDKEKKKVLFAESDKEFVDVLFSFLTIPLGTIVRLLDKQSQMGCLDEVYKSVEDLSSDYFQTKACKAMLLKPLNTASSHCHRLKINIDDTKPREVYVCKDTSCYAHCAFSSVPDTLCKCGKVMEYAGDRPEDDAKTAAAGSENGVFVKGNQKFITTDDLQVAPASTSLMLSLGREFGVQDPADLEQTILQLTSEKQPLTGLHFDVPITTDDASFCTIPLNLCPEQESDSEDNKGNVKIKVLQTKISSAVLYAEVGHDFVDLIFGLLSVPLGCTIKTLGQSLSKGCIGNLYRSIAGGAEGCMGPDYQRLLLAPELPPFFGSAASQILQAPESAPKNIKIDSCFSCFKIGGFSNLGRCREQDYRYNSSYRCWRDEFTNCQNTTKTAEICELDPKLHGVQSSNRDAYVKQGSQSFMVTDDLHVRPLTLDSSLRVVSEGEVQMKDLVEKEVAVTKFQIMELQRAALMTREALSSVLLPPKKKKKNLKHLMY